jgi:proteasome alpha subunit
MSIGFGYVTPEQVIKDKADLARKGIAKGRPLVVLEYAEGILFVADNPSTHLHKVSELYDRIAFAAVGRFSEFESLRVAGVRLADLRGYSYGREDVSSRSIANAYSQTLGQIFSEGPKPYEIELCVAEVGADGSPSALYHVLYDGTVADRKGYLAIGGQADELDAELRRGHSDGMELDAALGLAVRVLRSISQSGETSSRLEVAVLERGPSRRVFRRLTEDDVTNRTAVGSDAEVDPGIAPPEDGKAKDTT